MGKGMGAVDKNMRKELSLEIDGHACPDQYVNVGIGVEIKFRAPHAIDAMLIPWPRRLDGVHATHWLISTQAPLSDDLALWLRLLPVVGDAAGR